MDIVIRLPINYDDGIIIENDQAGFVRLKIETAFDNLDKQQEWEVCHKATRDWRDSEKYLLQNKFRQWMHGIVQKGLNDLNGQVIVNGINYRVTYKESGPAYTLNIQNQPGNEEFKLDVDLVPVIRFMYPRWPEGYRLVLRRKTAESKRHAFQKGKPWNAFPLCTTSIIGTVLVFQNCRRKHCEGLASGTQTQ